MCHLHGEKGRLLKLSFFCSAALNCIKNTSFPDKYFSSVILSSCRVATFARAHRASNPSPPALSAAPMFSRGFGYELSLSLSKALESESDSNPSPPAHSAVPMFNREFGYEPLTKTQVQAQSASYNLEVRICGLCHSSPETPDQLIFMFWIQIRGEQFEFEAMWGK